MINLYKDMSRYQEDDRAPFVDDSFAGDPEPGTPFVPEPEAPTVEPMSSNNAQSGSPNVWVPDADIPEYVPMGSEAVPDVMSESTDEHWFDGVLFDQEVNLESQMETNVEENQNQTTKTNFENAKRVTSLQKNFNGNTLMDLNSTAFKLKFNPRHRYDNCLKTLTTEEEIENMKGTGYSLLTIRKSTNRGVCFQSEV